MKKFIIISLLAIAGLVIFIPQPSLALDLQPGDLIKTSNSPAIYYFGYDGKRHSFPNSQTFYSWYPDYSNLKVISNVSLSSIPLGKNITIRPGTYLVKLKTDPKVYAVEPGGVLRYIASPADAVYLYGSSWATRVIDLPDYLMADYKRGQTLQHKQHPSGTIFKYTGEKGYFLLGSGQSRQFIEPVYWNGYHFNYDFTVEIDYQKFMYKKANNLNTYEAALADTAQTLIENDALKIALYNNNPVAYESALGDGLRGYYYSDKNFSNRVIDRIDPQIEFKWSSRPENDKRFKTNDFSIRWTGQIKITQTNNYKFFVYADDQVRLYIDDELVVSNWDKKRATWYDEKIRLEKGMHDIRLEYVDVSGSSNIKLCWNEKDEIIPYVYLFSN